MVKNSTVKREIQRKYNLLGEHFCGKGKAVWGDERSLEDAKAIDDKIMSIIAGDLPSPVCLDAAADLAPAPKDAQ